MPTPSPFTAAELTGRATTHVVTLEQPACTLHREVVAPFLALRAAAATEGIDLVPVSSFRDFDRQLAIWNGKFRGERPLLDPQGAVLEAAALSEAERVAAILYWSALPGASRHHWGSEVDVIDRAALPPGSSAQLLQSEFAPDGVFARLDRWLAGNMSRFGFCRPYQQFRGGVQPEPWHLSYAPVAERALGGLSLATLQEALAAAGLAGAPVVATRLPEIYARYVRNVDPPPALALAAAQAFSPAATRPS